MGNLAFFGGLGGGKGGEVDIISSFLCNAGLILFKMPYFSLLQIYWMA